MKNRLNLAVALGLTCVSCARNLRVDVQPHPNYPGSYLARYSPSERVLDDYGPGADRIRKAAKAQGSYVEADAIWNKAYEDAVPLLLQQKQLIPAQCSNGIVVTGVALTKAAEGTGTAVFRCK